jgi:hypothetical protein
MKRKITLLIMLVMVLSMCFGAVGAFAAGEDESGVRTIMIPPSDKKYMAEVWSKMGENGEYLEMEFKENSRNDNTDTRLLEYDDQSGSIEFKIENFRSATEKSRSRALATFVTELQDSAVSGQTQKNIMDTMNAMDKDVSLLLLPIVMQATSADVYTAMKWVAPLLSIVRVILGVGAVLITIFLVGSTVLDMAFIGLPFARNWMDDRASENGNQKPKFVTNEALSAVKQTEASLDSSGGYKNAYLIYFKLRIVTYIILSICLLYLVLGEIGGLIAWLLKLGSGVV